MVGSIVSPLLRGLAAAALLAFAAGPAAAQKFDNVTLTIATFGGPWTDRLTAELTEKMASSGITLKFIGGGTEEFLAQLIAARGQTPPFDVVEISDATLPDLLRGQFIRKLDLSAIANLKDLDPSMYDDYQVAYWATEPGFVYNIDKLKEAGIEPPKTYTDLLNPALSGRVLLWDLVGYLGYHQILGMAYEHGGDESNPQPGFDAFATMRPHSYTGSVAQTMQLFKSGDVWVGAISAHLGIRMNRAGINTAAYHPVVDGHKGELSRGYLGAVAGSGKEGAAEYFIDAVIDPTVQENLYNWAATIPTNNITMTRVLDKVDLDSTGTPYLQMDPAVVAQAWVPDLAKVDKRKWVRSWQRMVAAQQ